MTKTQAVKRPEGYEQVCLLPATIVGPDSIQDFEKFFAEEFAGTRIKYLEEIKTKPDRKDGKPVSGTGGRNDVLFAVHKDDVAKFAVPRLKVGIRWIEDVLDNERRRTPRYSIYPTHVREYRTW